MKKQIKSYFGSIILATALATVGLTGPAQADLYIGSSGSLAASVDFSINGSGQLVVVLTNTSTADVLVPADVLTAVFFTANSALTPVSAVITAGSTFVFDSVAPIPIDGNVGGEWAYASVPWLGGIVGGISSAGFGLFGDANFNGPNLQGPIAVNGMQYGITSAGDNTATGNAAVTGGNAFVQNSVTFTFAAGSGFDLSSIRNVSFQYGTSLTEPNVPSRGVPEPASALLLGSGLVAAGLWRRFRKAA